METPHERNLKWILAASIIMLFGSGYIYSLSTFAIGYSGRDAWYFLRITLPLFQILAIGSSALYIAGFTRRWTYNGAVFFFAVSVLLMFILGLRGFF